MRDYTNQLQPTYFIINIIFYLVLCGCQPSRTDQRMQTKVNEILENNKICINIDSFTWFNGLERNDTMLNQYTYYCDTNLFKQHYLFQSKNMYFFLVEGKIGHGSGEYDNFVIKTDVHGNGGITQYFKGYLQKIDISKSVINFSYKFYTDINQYCVVNGTFKDSVIISYNNKHSKCDNPRLIVDSYVWND